MEKEMKKSTIVILLIIILLIQLIARIYVGFKKEYFHIDEAYSYSLMNYDKINITDNADFYDNWHTQDYYLNYLSVNKEEKLNLLPVYENQKNDVHPPLYYLFLRIAATCTINQFTKWTGIALNIIISVFSSIVVYLIAIQIFKNKKMALLTCLITGLSMGALDTTAYIRMYELSNFFVLLITYLHLKLYSEKEIKIKQLCAIGISILLGSFTHYYVVVYTVFLFVIFVIKYICAKEYKNLIKYVVCFTIAAILSISIFPYSLVHIFGGYRGQEAKSNLFNAQSIYTNIGTYLYILSKNLFNIFYVFVVTLLIVLYIKKRKSIVIESEKLKLILIPTIMYFITIAQISSYKELRYIMPIISTSMISMIYIFYIVFKQYFTIKKTQIIIAIMFIIIIVSPIFTNSHLDFTYTKMNNLATKMEEKSAIPALYIFNESNMRFLDDIYIFTKFNDSYIMRYSKANIDNIKNVLSNKDISNGIIFLYNEGVDEVNIINNIKEEYNYKNEEDVQKLNAGMIKYLY